MTVLRKHYGRDTKLHDTQAQRIPESCTTAHDVNTLSCRFLEVNQYSSSRVVAKLSSIALCGIAWHLKSRNQ